MKNTYYSAERRAKRKLGRYVRALTRTTARAASPMHLAMLHMHVLPPAPCLCHSHIHSAVTSEEVAAEALASVQPGSGSKRGRAASKQPSDTTPVSLSAVKRRRSSRARAPRASLDSLILSDSGHSDVEEPVSEEEPPVSGRRRKASRGVHAATVAAMSTPVRSARRAAATSGRRRAQGSSTRGGTGDAGLQSPGAASTERRAEELEAADVLRSVRRGNMPSHSGSGGGNVESTSRGAPSAGGAVATGGGTLYDSQGTPGGPGVAGSVGFTPPHVAGAAYVAGPASHDVLATPGVRDSTPFGGIPASARRGDALSIPDWVGSPQGAGMLRGAGLSATSSHDNAQLMPFVSPAFSVDVDDRPGMNVPPSLPRKGGQLRPRELQYYVVQYDPSAGATTMLYEINKLQADQWRDGCAVPDDVVHAGSLPPRAPSRSLSAADMDGHPMRMGVRRGGAVRREMRRPGSNARASSEASGNMDSTPGSIDSRRSSTEAAGSVRPRQDSGEHSRQPSPNVAVLLSSGLPDGPVTVSDGSTQGVVPTAFISHPTRLPANHNFTRLGRLVREGARGDAEPGSLLGAASATVSLADVAAYSHIGAHGSTSAGLADIASPTGVMPFSPMPHALNMSSMRIGRGALATGDVNSPVPASAGGPPTVASTGSAGSRRKHSVDAASTLADLQEQP